MLDDSGVAGLSKQTQPSHDDVVLVNCMLGLGVDWLLQFWPSTRLHRAL